MVEKGSLFKTVTEICSQGLKIMKPKDGYRTNTDNNSKSLLGVEYCASLPWNSTRHETATCTLPVI